jgi:hypothetical protein
MDRGDLYSFHLSPLLNYSTVCRYKKLSPPSFPRRLVLGLSIKHLSLDREFRVEQEVLDTLFPGPIACSEAKFAVPDRGMAGVGRYNNPTP